MQKSTFAVMTFDLYKTGSDPFKIFYMRVPIRTPFHIYAKKIYLLNVAPLELPTLITHCRKVVETRDQHLSVQSVQTGSDLLYILTGFLCRCCRNCGFSILET